MSTRTNYSDEEWKAISGSPVAAGLLITLADASGPAGIAKEALAVGRTITESATGEAPEIVRALAEDVKSRGGRPDLPELPSGDRMQTKNALIGLITTAVHAVERTSPAEADAYKQWLASLASKVAQASKEGGFLGFGGIVVSPEEGAALKQLDEVLGITSRQTPEPS